MTDAERKAPRKGLWLVMDGRSRFDVDDATILEACGQGREDNVPRNAASRDWSGHDACLCFSPANDDGTYGPSEYVEDVK